MSHFGFVYDQTLCIGCNACQMACMDKNNLEQGLFFRRVDTLEAEEKGKKIWMHYSGSCNHCEKPACVDACPTGAMHKNADGTVGQDRTKCIGCGSCTWACPYGAPKLSHKLGIAMKCGACADFRAQGKNPACVGACLTHCLRFVDFDTMLPEEKEYYVSTLPILPKDTITHPNLLIRAKKGGISGE